MSSNSVCSQTRHKIYRTPAARSSNFVIAITRIPIICKTNLIIKSPRSVILKPSKTINLYYMKWDGRGIQST